MNELDELETALDSGKAPEQPKSDELDELDSSLGDAKKEITNNLKDKDSDQIVAFAAQQPKDSEAYKAAYQAHEDRANRAFFDKAKEITPGDVGQAAKGALGGVWNFLNGIIRTPLLKAKQVLDTTEASGSRALGLDAHADEMDRQALQSKKESVLSGQSIEESTKNLYRILDTTSEGLTAEGVDAAKKYPYDQVKDFIPTAGANGYVSPEDAEKANAKYHHEFRQKNFDQKVDTFKNEQSIASGRPLSTGVTSFISEATGQGNPAQELSPEEFKKYNIPEARQDVVEQGAAAADPQNIALMAAPMLPGASTIGGGLTKATGAVLKSPLEAIKLARYIPGRTAKQIAASATGVGMAELAINHPALAAKIAAGTGVAAGLSVVGDALMKQGEEAISGTPSELTKRAANARMNGATDYVAEGKRILGDAATSAATTAVGFAPVNAALSEGEPKKFVESEAGAAAFGAAMNSFTSARPMIVEAARPHLQSEGAKTIDEKSKWGKKTAEFIGSLPEETRNAALETMGAFSAVPGESESGAKHRIEIHVLSGKDYADALKEKLGSAGASDGGNGFFMSDEGSVFVNGAGEAGTSAANMNYTAGHEAGGHAAMNILRAMGAKGMPVMDGMMRAAMKGLYDEDGKPTEDFQKFVDSYNLAFDPSGNTKAVDSSDKKAVEEFLAEEAGTQIAGSGAAEFAMPKSVLDRMQDGIARFGAKFLGLDPAKHPMPFDRTQVQEISSVVRDTLTQVARVPKVDPESQNNLSKPVFGSAGPPDAPEQASAPVPAQGATQEPASIPVENPDLVREQAVAQQALEKQLGMAPQEASSWVDASDKTSAAEIVQDVINKRREKLAAERPAKSKPALATASANSNETSPPQSSTSTVTAERVPGALADSVATKGTEQKTVTKTVKDEDISTALKQADETSLPSVERARTQKSRARISREARLDALSGLLGTGGESLRRVTDPLTKEVAVVGRITPDNNIHRAILNELGYTPEQVKTLTDIQDKFGKGAYLRDYRSAEQAGFEEGGTELSAEARQKEYQASPAEDRAAGVGSESAQDKPFTPFETVLTKEGVVIRGFDQDKFLSNMRFILDSAKEHGVTTGYEGMNGKDLDETIAKDFQTVAYNHSIGASGEGKLLKGVEHDPDKVPVALDKSRADAINMAMNNRSAKPPGAPRGKTELAILRNAKAKDASNEAIGLADRNSGFLNIETGETNPLREKLEAAGLNVGKTLKPTVANVRPDLIAGGVHDTPTHGKSVHAHGFDIPAGELTASGVPQGKKVAAGFQPKSGGILSDASSSIKSKKDDLGGVPKMRSVLDSFIDQPEKIKPGYFDAKPIDKAQTTTQNDIAKAYDALKTDNLSDPKVKQAYDALVAKLHEQYNSLVDAGIKIEPWTKDGQPYANSKELQADLKDNDHLYYFPTNPESFGSSDNFTKEHPMLQDSGIKASDGTPLLNNDILRSVHDAIAHGAYGVQFGPSGEEAAWKAHMATVDDPAARLALTTETRGQNSWVNFRDQFIGKDGLPIKKGEDGYVAPKDRPFADQKADLLPAKYALTGDPHVDSIMGKKGLEGGAAFAKFFHDTENTKDGGAKFNDIKDVLQKPIEGFEPELAAYLRFGSNFQKHIFTSIPGFIDARIRLMKGLKDFAVSRDGETKMLDITSSEGYFPKAWASLSQKGGADAKADALDALPAFQKAFNTKEQVPGVKFKLAAWGDGFTDPTTDQKIPSFEPKGKYDIVHEGMGFQFFTPDRANAVKEVKSLLNKDGVFVTLEKFKNPDYAEREKLKNEYKSQFYSKDQTDAKAKAVLNSDENSVGMDTYQIDREKYEKILADNFDHVKQIWSSGNFAGYIASDSSKSVKKIVDSMGDTTTKFSVEDTPRDISFQPKSKEDLSYDKKEGSTGWILPSGKFKGKAGVHQNLGDVHQGLLNSNPEWSEKYNFKNDREGAIKGGLVRVRESGPYLHVEALADKWNRSKKDTIIEMLAANGFVQGANINLLNSKMKVVKSDFIERPAKGQFQPKGILSGETKEEFKPRFQGGSLYLNGDDMVADSQAVKDAKENGASFDEMQKLQMRLHPQARAERDRIFDAAISKPPTKDDELVIMSAGGPGSGKSTSLHGQEEPAIIYDTNLRDPEKAKKQIDAAVDSGRHVQIRYVYRPFKDAVKSNIDRVKDRGSLTTAEDISVGHNAARSSIEELMDHYKDDPNVDFDLRRNEKDLQPMTEDELRALPAPSVDELRKTAYDAADEHATEANREAVNVFKGLEAGGEEAGRKGVLERQRATQAEASFQPKGILSDTSIKSKKQDDLGLYSELRHQADLKLPNRASADQIKATLAKSGAKAEEIEWSGLNDWLDEQKGPVSKADVLDYLDKNDVKIVEVTKGKDVPLPPIETSFEEIVPGKRWWVKPEGRAYNGRSMQRLIIKQGENAYTVERSNDVYTTLDRARIAAEDLVKNDAKSIQEAYPRDFNGTKYGDLTIPGGENYKEKLYILPTKNADVRYVWRPTEDSDPSYIKGDYVVVREVNGEEKEIHTSYATSDEAFRSASDLNNSINLENPKSQTFTHGHWDNQNVVLHTRESDHTTGDARTKTLEDVRLIEENQSDWHKKGKKEGYGGMRDGWRAEKYNDGWKVFNKENEHVATVGSGGGIDTPEAAIKQAGVAMGLQNGVPDAPFKKSWPELGFKVALQGAIKDGKKWLAWTTGEQQADRYSLSNHFQSIRSVKLEDGKYRIEARGKGDKFFSDEFTADKLPDVVGRELADKIINTNPDTDKEIEDQAIKVDALKDVMTSGPESGKEADENLKAYRSERKKLQDMRDTQHDEQNFEGLDLKVGGEGMKGFYDDIMGSIARKYAKKYGSEVKDIQLNNYPENPHIEWRDRYPRIVDEEDNVVGTYNSGAEADEALKNMTKGGDTVHALRITPEMSGRISEEGLPKFQPKAATTPEEVKRNRDTIAQAAWIAQKLAGNTLGLSEDPDKVVALAAKWRQDNPRESENEHGIPEGFLRQTPIPAQSVSSEDAARSRDAFVEQNPQASQAERNAAALKPLLDASRESGRIFSPDLRKLAGDEGVEHQVLLLPGRVLKVTMPGKFAAKVDMGDQWHPEMQPADPAEYLRRIELFNRIFGDDIRIEGVMDDGNGNYSIVTSQPTIKGTQPTTQEAMKAMKEGGFVKVSDRGFYNPETNVYAHDLHTGNFVKVDSGDVVPIDAVMSEPEPGSWLHDWLNKRVDQSKEPFSVLSDANASSVKFQPTKQQAKKILDENTEPLRKDDHEMFEGLSKKQLDNGLYIPELFVDKEKRGGVEGPRKLAQITKAADVQNRDLFMQAYPVEVLDEPGPYNENRFNSERDRLVKGYKVFGFDDYGDGWMHREPKSEDDKASGLFQPKSGILSSIGSKTMDEPPKGQLGLSLGKKYTPEQFQQAAAKRKIELSNEKYPEALPLDYRKENGKYVIKDGQPIAEKQTYDLADAPLAKEAAKGIRGDDKRATAIEDAYANKLVDQFDKIKDQPNIMVGKDWYNIARGKIKKLLGDDTILFAQLLGATSARTPADENFHQAVDAYNGIKNGRFDGIADKYLKAKEAMESGEGLTFGKDFENIKKGTPVTGNTFRQYLDSEGLIPKRENGKKYNANSQQVLRVIAGDWEDNVGGPKTPNFAKNLSGRSIEATVDVWAARGLHRLGNEGYSDRWRILPEAETGVKDADFNLGQAAYRKAAAKLGMNPDDLQGIMWFAEKTHWANKGWTRAAGAALSDFSEWLSQTKREGDQLKVEDKRKGPALFDLPATQPVRLTTKEKYLKDMAVK